MAEFKLITLEEAIRKAVASSLNKMAARLVTAISRYLRTHYNIKKRDLDKNFSVEKATSKKPIATILVSGERLSLSMFNPKQTEEGVQIIIVKGKPVTIKNVFTGARKVGALGAIGNLDVFQRKGKKRLPIKQITGPDVASLARSKEVSSIIELTFNREWEPLFQSELRYYRSRTQ
ncbi:MAG: phage tail protein [Candidatus Magasanikiibacteriota bacterium]